MATGPADEPWLAPGSLVCRVLGLGRLLDALSPALAGHRLDPLALLAERSAVAGLSRHGRTSCGQATRLLEVADGWLALCLARPDDVDALEAWLETPIDRSADPPWDDVAGLVSGRPVGPLVARASLLGLPVAALGSVIPSGPAVRADAVVGPPARPLDPADALVVDLSSLWAGPLCTHLLGLAGARIVKVESTVRPDGARLGPPEFFDLLHAGQGVALDLATGGGRSTLRRLLAAADVVVEASRPRALEQLGLGPRERMADGRARAWVSITGYGRTGDAAARVAFGDDAAVAGGLVAGRAGRPGDGRPVVLRRRGGRPADRDGGRGGRPGRPGLGPAVGARRGPSPGGRRTRCTRRGRAGRVAAGLGAAGPGGGGPPGPAAGRAGARPRGRHRGGRPVARVGRAGWPGTRAEGNQ